MYAPAVRNVCPGWARYLSVTEASHNIESFPVSGEETYVPKEVECQRGRNPRFPTLEAAASNAAIFVYKL